MRSVRILHLIAGELAGGAAKGALNLHKAILSHGIKSHILTTAKDTLNDDTISNINKYKAFFYAKLDSGISRLCGAKNIFSNNFLGVNISQNIHYKNVDIIHLHWVNNGFISLRTIAQIDKPIVWSVRDMWAFSGGCHYALADNKLCFKFKSDCSHCPQLKPKIKPLDNIAFLNQKLKKRFYPSTLHFVGISSFISKCLASSVITKDFPICTILNCINPNDFIPINKNIAKQILNIKTHKKVILCGANALNDFYKGFDYFLESLTYLQKDRYFLCFFGKFDERLIPRGFEFKSFGYHNSNIALSLLYSAADVFVAPSLLDAAPKTIMESLSCATPAISFDNSGGADIIKHKKSGYLAKAFYANDLANGIEFIANAKNYDEISHFARESAISTFSADIIAKQYIDLYANIISDLGDARIANGGGQNVDKTQNANKHQNINKTQKLAIIFIASNIAKSYKVSKTLCEYENAA